MDLGVNMSIKFYDGYSSQTAPTVTTAGGATGLQGATGIQGEPATAVSLNDLSGCETINESVYIGSNAGRYEGSNSVGIGNGAIEYDDGVGNIGIGWNAGNGNYGRSYNIAIGRDSNRYANDCDYTVGIGQSSGASYNVGSFYAVGIGYEARAGLKSVAIGFRVETPYAHSIVFGEYMVDEISTGVAMQDNQVVLGGENITSTILRGVVRYTPIVQPSSGIEGDTYYDKNSHKLRYYNGTEWVDC